MQSSKDLEEKEKAIADKNIQLSETEQQVEQLQVGIYIYIYSTIMWHWPHPFRTAGRADYDSTKIQGCPEQLVTETSNALLAYNIMEWWIYYSTYTLAFRFIEVCSGAQRRVELCAPPLAPLPDTTNMHSSIRTDNLSLFLDPPLS